ncbi:synaptic plasticity regulator PANTS isoform X1 [Lithobates pipiens]
MAELWRPPRDCDDYWDEWKYCKSLRHRFHYYYTYGGKPDCQQWKADYTACKEWERRKSQAAKEALLQSEKARQNEKQNNNPVWTMRKRPPADWHLPLDR